MPQAPPYRRRGSLVLRPRPQCWARPAAGPLARPRSQMLVVSAQASRLQRAPAALPAGSAIAALVSGVRIQPRGCSRPRGFSVSPLYPRPAASRRHSFGPGAEPRFLGLGPAPRQLGKPRSWRYGMHKVRASLSSLLTRGWKCSVAS